MYLNGKRVGDSYFNPGLTQYNKTHQYQTYDVTNLLNQGANALGAMVSEGWWSGQLSYGNTWHAFGDRQALLSKLVVTYHDGSRDVFVSSPEHWAYSVAGPVRYSSLNMGEIYDARLEAAIDGWDKAGFDDGLWQPVEVVPLEDTQSFAVRPNMSFTSQSWDFSEQALVGQIDEPARIFKTLQAQSVSEVRPGVFVYDLGQNIVGVPKIHLPDGIAGKPVTLRFAEMLYPDLPESGPNVGMIVTENYRAALSQDIYIMRQGEQTYQPYFTSHGFRYIEITGIEKPLPISAVQGLAMSSIQQLNAEFQTSNPKVNKLWQNLTWSAIDNFLSVPTDCPQRNERMGWSGDINVFSRTATYLTDAAPFLSRHLLGMRDIQPDNGRFTDIAPLGGGFGGVLWGSAGITVAWENYQQYGDVATLREHYPAMVRYMDYLDSVIDPENGILMDAQLGDWLGPQNGQLGSIYLASAYHVFTLKIMQNVATVLDRPNDAQKYAEQHQQRRDYFNSTFIKDGQPQGIVGSGPMFNAMVPPFKTQTAATQTAYAVPLALDVFADEQRSVMAAGLAKVLSQSNVDDGGIERPPYSLMTGFIGTAWISKALSDAGYDDDAYRLLTNETYPSWLYSVNQGATTIWERLNGYTVENGFGGNNSMNSFNHYSFGAVGQWMMANAAGIQRAEPGFHHFVLQPSIDRSGSIEWVKGHYDSPYGRIESAWKLVDGVLNYQATVPANTTAQLVLPRGAEVKEGGKSLVEGNGISDIVVRDGKLMLRLGSGSYDFTASGI
jgi:alpha-L-rhamnosidase